MPTNSSIVLDFRPVIDEYKQNGNNIWDAAYKNATLPYEQELASATSQFEYGSERLKEDYGEAINKAYESYVANKRAAEFSNYGTGDIRTMIDAMGKAYDENKRNIFETYLANQESLDTRYKNVVSSYYQQALSTQNLLEQEKSNLAENYANTVYSIHGYLNKLLDNNPELFKTNPLLNKFAYYDDDNVLSLVDEKGFIETLSELNLETGERTMKLENGLEDLFNLVTSFGGLNDENTLSYESYMREYENDLYNWLSDNSNQNLYRMYDILGFNPQGLFGQSTATYNGKVEKGAIQEYRGKLYKYDGKEWIETENNDRVEYQQIEDNLGMYKQISDKTFTINSSTGQTKLSIDGVTYDTKRDVPDETETLLNKIGKQGVVMFNDKTYAYVARKHSSGGRKHKKIVTDYEWVELIKE